MLGYKEINQLRNVVPPVAQWWNRDWYDVEPVVEVFAEASIFDHRFKISIGCADDPHVYFHGLRSPDAHDLLLLKRAQDLGLHADVQVAYLVKEQRAVVGYFKLPLFLCVRAGERTLLVTEELRFGRFCLSRRNSA